MSLSRRRRRVLAAVAASALVLVGAGLHRLGRLVAVGAAYKAKVLCSGVFVAGRTPEAVLGEDLAADDLRPLRLLRARIDQEGRSATASLLGLFERTAVYRSGLGCALALGASPASLRAQAEGIPAAPGPPGDPRPWPEGDAPDPALPPNPRLEAALDRAFAEPDPARRRRTRAVVVVHRGRIAAERYAPGISPATPLPGWSLAKTALGALAGIAVGQGRLNLADRALLPEWGAPGDPRAGISVTHLLRMTSGLAFEERGNRPLQDVTFMLLGSGDAAGYAAAKALASPPGARWSYSSADTNLLSRVLRRALGPDYLCFPRRSLFGPLGMATAVLEADAAGDFVGSSFLYASARDWARLGLLFLNDGAWSGRRILPEGWVGWCRRAGPDPRYGAHAWLELPTSSSRLVAAVPSDATFGLGHEGQLLAVIPSRGAVVVRLGLTRREGAWDHRSFLADLLAALPP